MAKIREDGLEIDETIVMDIFQLKAETGSVVLK